MCYSVGGKDMVFVLMFLTASKSMWFSLDENLKSQRVELIFQETVARQSNCRLMLVQGLAGTQGRGCVWGASCSEVRGSFVICHPQRAAEKAQVILGWLEQGKSRVRAVISLLWRSRLREWPHTVVLRGFGGVYFSSLKGMERRASIL